MPVDTLANSDLESWALTTQAIADIVADPTQSPSLRIAGLHVLDAGATEWVHLSVEETQISLSQFAFLIVMIQSDRGLIDEAVESLVLFTGSSPHEAERLLYAMFEFDLASGGSEGDWPTRPART